MYNYIFVGRGFLKGLLSTDPFRMWDYETEHSILPGHAKRGTYLEQCQGFVVLDTSLETEAPRDARAVPGQFGPEQHLGHVRRACLCCLCIFPTQPLGGWVTRRRVLWGGVSGPQAQLDVVTEALSIIRIRCHATSDPEGADTRERVAYRR